MSKGSIVDFTQGDIARSMFLFTLPIILGELLQNLYNSVDALVVGNFIGENALAAVVVCSMISNIVISFFNGMSVGANVVVSKAFGAGDAEALRLTVRHTFSFAVLLGFFLSILGILFSPQLLMITGAKEEYYAEAISYLRVYLAGLMFTVIYNNGAGILRAIGDTRTPFLILLTSCVVNICLDLLFVKTFQLDVFGAGLATVFSQGLSVALVYRAINARLNDRCINFLDIFQNGGGTVRAVLDIGFSAGVQNALVSFSNIFIVQYMNWFDTAAVAGIGIAQRLDKFILLPAKAFGITITTYVSQNLGAGRYDRLRMGKNRCIMLAMTVTVGLSVLVFLFSRNVVAIFNSDPDVVAVGEAMMHAIIPFFWIVSLREIFLGILRGYGKARIPMLLAVLNMVVLRQIFLAVSMRINPTIENIFVCYPLTHVTTILSILGYWGAVKKNLVGLGRARKSYYT